MWKADANTDRLFVFTVAAIDGVVRRDDILKSAFAIGARCYNIYTRTRTHTHARTRTHAHAHCTRRLTSHNFTVLPKITISPLPLSHTYFHSLFLTLGQMEWKVDDKLDPEASKDFKDQQLYLRFASVRIY